MQITAKIGCNHKGNYNLSILGCGIHGFSIATVRERHVAQALRHLCLQEFWFRSLPEWSRHELVENTLAWRSQCVSDQPNRKLRFIWGPAREDEWNQIIVPAWLRDRAVVFEDSEEPIDDPEDISMVLQDSDQGPDHNGAHDQPD